MWYTPLIVGMQTERVIPLRKSDEVSRVFTSTRGVCTVREVQQEANTRFNQRSRAFARLTPGESDLRRFGGECIAVADCNVELCEAIDTRSAKGGQFK